MGGKRKVRSYSPTEKASALAVAAGIGLDHPSAVSRAAAMTGIPVSTIRTWLGEHREAVRDASEVVDECLLPKLWEVREAALDQVAATIGEAKAKDAMLIAAIATDKALTITGRDRPGVQVNINTVELDPAAVAEIVRLAAKMLDGRDCIDVEPGD